MYQETLKWALYEMINNVLEDCILLVQVFLFHLLTCIIIIIIMCMSSLHWFVFVNEVFSFITAERYVLYLQEWWQGSLIYELI